MGGCPTRAHPGSGEARPQEGSRVGGLRRAQSDLTERFGVQTTHSLSPLLHPSLLIGDCMGRGTDWAHGNHCRCALSSQTWRLQDGSPTGA